MKTDTFEILSPPRIRNDLLDDHSLTSAKLVHIDGKQFDLIRVQAILPGRHDAIDAMADHVLDRIDLAGHFRLSGTSATVQMESVRFAAP